MYEVFVDNIGQVVHTKNKKEAIKTFNYYVTYSAKQEGVFLFADYELAAEYNAEANEVITMLPEFDMNDGTQLKVA